MHPVDRSRDVIVTLVTCTAHEIIFVSVAIRFVMCRCDIIPILITNVSFNRVHKRDPSFQRAHLIIRCISLSR